MPRKYIVLLSVLALTACGDPKLEVAVYSGMHGATIARMAATGVRTSQAAKDRRFDSRALAQMAVVHDSLTPQMLRASIDSVAEDSLIVALISRFYMQSAIDAAQNLTRVGMPYLALHPTVPNITGGDTWGFSLVPDQNKEAAFIAKQIGAGKRVAIVHIDDAYGNGMAAAVASAVTAAGSTASDTRKYQQSWDEPRMVALGHDTRGGKPDVLVFAGRSPSLQLVIQPFQEAGEEVRVIGTDLVESSAVYMNPDGSFTGVEFVRFLDPRAEDERMQDLSGRYVLWIGSGQITSEGVLTYDAVHLIGEAVRAGARTRSQVREYLRSLGRSRPPFSGVGGLIAFGEDGQAQRDIHLVKVGRRGVEIVATDSVTSRR